MKKHLLAVAVAALAAGSAMAQANDTLAKVKSSGSITLGVRESSGALAYTLGDGKYVGFHTEMAENIVKDIQKQLGVAKVDVKYQPVTSQNRIPLVVNGTVKWAPSSLKPSARTEMRYLPSGRSRPAARSASVPWATMGAVVCGSSRIDGQSQAAG